MVETGNPDEVRKPRTFVFNAGGRLDNVVERSLLPEIKPAQSAEFDGTNDTARYERGAPRTNEGIHEAGLALTEKPPIYEIAAKYDHTPKTPDKFKP